LKPLIIRQKRKHQYQVDKWKETITLLKTNQKTMKHLLIIISFLLLSSPVIGDNHKGETLYLWETSSGLVWKTFGEKETHPKYEGDVENGVPNGQGTFTYPDGMKYVGGWKNGEMIGQGTFTYPYGEKYVGGFKGGGKNGQGTETYPDGKKYVGEWKNGVFHGKGTFTLPTGEKYEGEFKDGERNGQGTYTWSDGRKYVGEFKDGKDWNTTGYDKNGNIIGKIINGVRQ